MNEYSISPLIGLAFLLVSLGSVFYLYRKNRKFKYNNLDDFVQKPPLAFSQEAVMRDYERTEVLRKNRAAQGALHLFFSPKRVPAGLTDEEIAICVWLYQFRKAENDRRVQTALEKTQYGYNDEVPFENYLWPKPLPDEFGPSEMMTRERFKEGLYKHLAQVAKGEI